MVLLILYLWIVIFSNHVMNGRDLDLFGVGWLVSETMAYYIMVHCLDENDFVLFDVIYVFSLRFFHVKIAELCIFGNSVLNTM